jgi:hypothetical protein
MSRVGKCDRVSPATGASLSRGVRQVSAPDAPEAFWYVRERFQSQASTVKMIVL